MCIGFAGQDFGSGGCRSCSETSPMSDGANSSWLQDGHAAGFKKGEKPAQLQLERGVRIRERNSSAQTPRALQKEEEKVLQELEQRFPAAHGEAAVSISLCCGGGESQE